MTQQCALICLVVTSILTAGCTAGRTSATAPPPPTITPPATPGQAEASQIETLCLQIAESDLQYPDLNLINDPLERILGLTVTRVEPQGSAACEATLLVTLRGASEFGDYYNESEKRSHRCWTGASVSGEMTLQLPERPPLAVHMARSDPVEQVVLNGCASVAQSPLYRVSIEALLDGLRAIWGTSVVVYARAIFPKLQWATEALGELDPEQAVPEIVDVLETHPDAAVRTAALEALAEIGLSVSETLPAVRRRLQDADESVRETAVEVLALIEPAAPEVVRQSHLTKLKDSKWEDEDARIAAARFLGQSGADDVVIQALIGVLEDPQESDRMRAEAGAALANIGSASVPWLIEVLARQDADVKAARASALALKQIGRDSEAAIPVLMDCPGKAHSECEAALLAIGPAAAKPVVDRFVSLGTAGCDDQEARALATWSASSPEPRRAIPILIDCMELRLKGKMKWKDTHAALKIIAGVDFGNDVSAWRAWWAENH